MLQAENFVKIGNTANSCSRTIHIEPQPTHYINVTVNSINKTMMNSDTELYEDWQHSKQSQQDS